MDDSAGVDVGETVPNVSAPLVWPDDRVATTDLDSLVADGPVLLVFYTNDFSPDCVSEWCDFRDFGWFSTTDEVQVVGVSRSRERTHRRFIDYLDLPFPLFADRDLDLASAFDVRYRTLGLFARARRSVFLLDGDRTVQYRWVADHPIDPTRETPEMTEVNRAVTEYLDAAG
jgi:peroxiredoxin